MENSETDLEKLCRLCLSSDSENLHHIFEQELSNKIIILSGLELQSNDALPKHICKDCRYNLEKSYHLRMLAKQSDSRLRKHLRLVNQKKPSQVLLKGYRDDDSDEFEETFRECYKYFGEAYDEVNLMRRSFDFQKERIIKEAVEKAIEEYKATNAPVKASTPCTASKRVGIPSKNVSESPVVLNKCAPSTQRFESVPKVLRKRKRESNEQQDVQEIVLDGYEIKLMSAVCDATHHSQEYEFQVINENTEVEFVNDADFTEQVFEEEAEATDEEFKEPTQRQSKSSPRRKLKTEKQVKSTVEVLEETNDDNYFKAIDNVDGEDLDENGEKKIFQCAFEGCAERFARRQACKTHFYNHLASQALTKGFSCEFCQKTFKVVSALDRHKRVHTGDKPFKCDFEGCDKSFSQKEMLKRHKITHLSINDAPFACNFCDKRFRQKEPLRQHINKAHSEDAETKAHQFSCTICQKQFAHSSGLSRHLLIHSGRKFTCEVCDKAFNDQSALKRHGSVHSK